jgi:hypothetical protein
LSFFIEQLAMNPETSRGFRTISHACVERPLDHGALQRVDRNAQVSIEKRDVEGRHGSI